MHVLITNVCAETYINVGYMYVRSRCVCVCAPHVFAKWKANCSQVNRAFSRYIITKTRILK